jgi:hypothetical protein
MMKTRNDARTIERDLAERIENVREKLDDTGEMERIASALMELDCYFMAPEEHAMRGYLMGLQEAHRTMKEKLRRPRRRIQR